MRCTIPLVKVPNIILVIFLLVKLLSTRFRFLTVAFDLTLAFSNLRNQMGIVHHSIISTRLHRPEPFEEEVGRHADQGYPRDCPHCPCWDQISRNQRRGPNSLAVATAIERFCQGLVHWNGRTTLDATIVINCTNMNLSRIVNSLLVDDRWLQLDLTRV